MKNSWSNRPIDRYLTVTDAPIIPHRPKEMICTQGMISEYSEDRRREAVTVDKGQGAGMARMHGRPLFLLFPRYSNVHPGFLPSTPHANQVGAGEGSKSDLPERA